MTKTMQEPAIVARANAATNLLQTARQEVEKVVLGQSSVIEQALVTLLSGGHGLLVGAPGLAKTLLVETLSTVTGLSEQRIQFTPDLMPTDILGSEVLETDKSGKRKFRFIEGPVFCQLVMADEINRASPRTQSALLQAMQEHSVTVAGKTRALPEPFHVLATQNPIEQEGTYPLPEAQLDRFLLQIDIEYPDELSEREILIGTTGNDNPKPEQVMDGKKLLELQNLVRAMPVGESVVDAIVNLVRASRPDQSEDPDVRDHVIWGPGPRAGQALMLGVRARALVNGELAPRLEDVIALAGPALKHRMALGFSARAAGLDVDALIAKLVKQHV